MSIHEFVQQLEDQHIELRVVDGQVKVLAAKNILSGELLQQLRTRKDELLAFLSPTILPQKQLISPIEEQEHYSVSSAQKRIWIAEQLEKERTAYIITKSFLLEERMNKEVLMQSLRKLIQRHESLRTCFVMVDGEVRQKILNDVTFELNDVDSSIEKKTLQQIEEEEVSLPFDLMKAPLMRARLVKIEEDKYLFLLSLHHIISDGWSMEILMNELMQLYPTWPVVVQTTPMPLQYKDFTAWQHTCIAEGRWQKSLDHWRNLLQHYTETKLPATTSISSSTTGSANYDFLLGSSSAHALSRLGKKSDSSLFMVLLAVVQLLLYRYTGKTSLLTGIPTAGRDHRQLFNIVGFFVNVLPLKISFSTNDSFMAVLEKVKDELLACLEHQNYPFDEVIQNNSFPTAGGRMSVFNVVVDYNKEESQSQLINQTDSNHARSVKNKSSKFDFVFSFTETVEGIQVDFEYNTQLYNDWFVKQLADHFQCLIEKVIEGPMVSVGEILPFTREETQQLIEEYNNTAQPDLSNKTVKQVFEEVVSLHGERIALVDHNVQLSYYELNYKANQLVHYMCLHKSISPDEIVAVCMQRAMNFIISTLAIVKTGTAYVYIDVEYPEERIAYLLKDVNPVLILTDLTSIEKIRPVANEFDVIMVDDVSIVNYPTENPVSYKKASDLAYLMYTSGSTGLPKAVMLEDRGVVRLAKDNYYLKFNETNRLVLAGAVSFDAIILEMWLILLNGGELHLLSKEELLNISMLKEYISQYDINTMFFTTSWFNQLVETDIGALTALKKIMVGGEKLSSRHIRDVRQSFPQTQLLNLYGPTENTVVSTIYNIGEVIEENIPIGRSFTNSEVYIVNNEMQLTPAGVWGQIIVSGDGLARGYLNQPELTRQKFIRHPFKENVFAYTTGDMGRILPGGYVEYKTRMDEQLKIRGFRIEPGEIENTMLMHPEVHSALVLIKGKEQQKELIGFYTGNASDTAIRSFLVRRLPAHMIPSKLIQLQQFPLNASGKVDRAALLEMTNTPIAQSSSQMPLNKLQEQMVAIWEKILQVKPISIDDNFFEIGGHSLKAMQLIAELHKKLGIQLVLGDVFTHPTIKELCALTPVENNDATIHPAPRQDYYELSHAQLRLWISSQHNSVKHAFNMPGVYELKGAIDLDAFTRSFHAIIERHEILRTAFVMYNGQPRQKILSVNDLQFSVSVQQFSELNLDDLSLDEWIHARTEDPFLLEQPPLFRVHLLQIEKERSLLIFVLHHIISDEWSTRVFVQDFARLYNSFKSGNSESLSALLIQYKDYAHWHNEFLRSNAAEQQKQYWKSRFNGLVPALRFPADKPRPAVKTYNGSRHSLVLSQQEVLKLEKIARAENVTSYILLLSVFKTLFFAYTRQTDITIGVLSAARSNASLHDQIGFYINNLPIRSQINPTESFVSVLKQIRTDAVDAFTHQLYPFDLIVEHAGVQHQADRSPLFDVMIQLLHEGINLDENLLTDVVLTEKDINFLQTRYDLEITLLQSQARITCEIKYNTDIYARPTIVLLSERFKFLVRSIISNPLQTIEQLAASVAAYFPSPMEEAAVYHPSLNYLYWSNKINSFFANGSYKLNAPSPEQRVSHEMKVYVLNTKQWLDMNATEQWMMTMAALSLVFHKYGYDRILLASLPEGKDKCNELFFESCSQNDAIGLIHNFIRQYEEGIQFGNYETIQLIDHLLLNNICARQQIFELGVGLSSIHSIENIGHFRLLLLIDDVGSDYLLKLYFDSSQYNTAFVDQLAAHFAKAVDFLQPVISRKLALQS